MKLTRRSSNGVWYADLRAEGLGRRSTGKRDRAEALTVARAILRGEAPESNRAEAEVAYTVSDALDQTWEDNWRHRKSVDSIRYMVRTVRQELGDEPAAAITYQRVHEWHDKLLAEGKAASTINHYTSVLNTALTHVANLGKLTDVPKLPRKSVNNNRVRYLTHEEERALREATYKALPDEEAPIMCHLITVLIQTGCRVSEITQLDAREVRDGSIYLSDTKNTRPRTVPLTESAEESITALMESPVWTYWTDRSKANATQMLVLRFGKVRDAAGLRDVSLHVLRHTAASRLVQAGVDLYTVGNLLGHSSPQITARYAHLNVDHLRSAVRHLDQPDPEELDDNVVSLQRRRSI